ncbi:MAG: transposase [Phycisphaerales bacterium]|nr:MAG: transposase [Phycisphaerales bacterium]
MPCTLCKSEGQYALNWTRLSCHDFVDNQVRLPLSALAYNTGNFLRRLALPKSVKQWSLRTLRDKLIKIGAKVISHSRHVMFRMAEGAVPQILFREILDRIRLSRQICRSSCVYCDVVCWTCRKVSEIEMQSWYYST